MSSGRCRRAWRRCRRTSWTGGRPHCCCLKTLQLALMLIITSQALCLIIQHRCCTACPSPELPPDVAAAITCRQHTERLRDRAAAILKEELAEMRRREKRAEVDVNYVKDVIVRCSLRSCA